MKHIYYTGLRTYISSAYNFMIYLILSLYTASYTLRIIVYEWVQEPQYDYVTKEIRNRFLQNRTANEVEAYLDEWKAMQKPHISYFIEACKWVTQSVFIYTHYSDMDF